MVTYHKTCPIVTAARMAARSNLKLKWCNRLGRVIGVRK